MFQSVRETRDHPRLRGEKELLSQIKLFCQGSPPLARGKVIFLLSLLFLWGITPACAGKSSGGYTLFDVNGDHPRLRGEKNLLEDNYSREGGSPPLARGKALKVAAHSSFRRITPACAGKSGRRSPTPPDTEDHPRLRGEKQVEADQQRTIQGSPPLARGKVLLHKNNTTNIRITPACAGKSPGSCPWRRHAWDHPRLRGEKLLGPADQRPLGRITPACAGKSEIYQEGYMASKGSPPLARGKVERE